ncbi:hypothetical protein SAY87_022369 [Trapa incisa]|uniref:Secreted protein n=1 Tax=Trapa incisa TaxID=236973 RepID=A0AAN7K0W1_9MYRT|nr:hypothetical protein SAY87_022369 [Trapa incisa]
MRPLLVLFLLAFLVVEAIQGADGRSLPGLKGQQLSQTSEASTVGGATTAAASTTNGNTAGSLSSTNSDDDFWNSPSEGETHHVHLDYNHPGRRSP